MKTNPITSTNFTGIHVSDIKIKGIDSTYKLYNITNSDGAFLDKMKNSIDLKKLYSAQTKEDYDVWCYILEKAIDGARNFDLRKTIIETCDNVICGILNYSAFGNNFHVNHVTTFPNKPNQRVPYAGKILFNELYRRMPNPNAGYVELNALIFAPFDPTTKYYSMGFKIVGGNNYINYMRINRQRAAEKVEQQKKYMDVLPSENKSEIDLLKTIDFWS